MVLRSVNAVGRFLAPLRCNGSITQSSQKHFELKVHIVAFLPIYYLCISARPYEHGFNESNDNVVAKQSGEELNKDNEALRAINAKLQEALDVFQVKYRKTSSELDHALEISAKPTTAAPSLPSSCTWHFFFFLRVYSYRARADVGEFAH